MGKLFVFVWMIAGMILATGCSNGNMEKDSVRATTESAITDGLVSGTDEIEEENQSANQSKESPFFVTGKDGTLYLGDWDHQMDLEKIFGSKLSEEIVILGEGADTFTGSFIKTIEFEGLKVTLFSPTDNGKTFWVQSMIVTSKDYEILKGIQIEDRLDFVKKEIGNSLLESNVKDGNQLYSYAIELDTIVFTFSDDILEKIEIKKEMP
jgi:hypothetical protein